MADDECTYWLDGWPTWAGGNGHEWLGCCIAHDHTAMTTDSALALGACVSHTSSGMAAIMVLGLMIFGPIYKIMLHFTR